MIKLNNNSIIGGTIILMVILITLAVINFPEAVATDVNTGGGCCGNNSSNSNSSNSNIYGKTISENSVISIKELLNKKNYLGKTVKIEGTITEVCQDMGCWFNVNDKTGTMYIDLEMGKYFTIPKNSAKSHVIVEGGLKEKDGKIFITGYGVKIGN